jgi:hypothetical protein
MAYRLLQVEIDLGLQEELSSDEVRSLTHGTSLCPRGCRLRAGVQICHARVNHGSSISSYVELYLAVKSLVAAVVALLKQGRSIPQYRLVLVGDGMAGMTVPELHQSAQGLYCTYWEGDC